MQAGWLSKKTSLKNDVYLDVKVPGADPLESSSHMAGGDLPDVLLSHEALGALWLWTWPEEARVNSPVVSGIV